MGGASGHLTLSMGVVGICHPLWVWWAFVVLGGWALITVQCWWMLVDGPGGLSSSFVSM